MKNVKNNKEDAKIIIDYAKIECDNLKILLPMLDDMLIDKTSDKKMPEGLDDWNWKIAEFIEFRTSYIAVDISADADFEAGEWGMPVAGGGMATPIGVEVNDKDNLMVLRQEIDAILNHTIDKIPEFISMKDRPKWKCKKCGRFLGKELSSLDEIKKLLRNFNIKKYWKCRSCKTPNYFEFNGNEIIFKSDLTN